MPVLEAQSQSGCTEAQARSGPTEAQAQSGATGVGSSIWDDMLSMLQGALRDAERIKDHLVTECDVDLERIRSAFNCQEPGNATLSAEQIVVEHAVEQVRSTLNCANPDTSNLHDHEEVIERNPRPPPTPPSEEQDSAAAEKRDDGFAGDDEAPAQSAFEQPAAQEPATDLLDLQAKVQEPPAAKQQMPVEQPPVDLLDLSATVQELPGAKEQAPADLLDLSLDEGAAKAPVEQAPVDLLDAEFASQEFTPFVSASFPEKPPMDLMDMAAEVQTPAKSVPEDYESLLQLSGSPVALEMTQPDVQAILPKVVAEPVDLL